MNSIIKKALLVLAAIFAIYTAAIYSFMEFAVLPSFARLQDAAVRDEVNRCELILKKEMATLSAVCADWSAWDDACQFISDRNEAFIKSALDPAGIQNINVNAAIFMDTKGKVVWGKVYDWKAGKEISIPELSPERMSNSPFFYAYDSVTSERTGLIRLGDRIGIAASRPVVSSKKELPIYGALVMVRFINEDDVKELAQSLGTEFVVRPADQVAARPQAGEEYAIERFGSKSVKATALVNDVFGNPTMAIVADIPTPIITRGIWVHRFVSFSIGLAGIVTLIIASVLLKKMILSRLEELSAILGKFAATGPGTADSEQGQGDELGRHNDMVMRMLERLDSAEQALGASDQRFSAAFFNAPFPIAIHDQTGKVVQLNSQWTRATGYTIEDMPDTKCWCRTAFGSGAQAAMNRLEVLYRTGEAYATGDIHVRCKDGRNLLWSFSSSPIGKSAEGVRQFITVAVDVTERVVALRRLRENESLFRSLTESIPAVTYLAAVSPEAKLSYVSPQTMTFFGFRPDDMKNMVDPWKMVISPEYYDKVMDGRFRSLASTTQQFTAQYSALGRSGETMWLREDAIVVNTEKGPMIQGILFDITETMQLRNHPARSTCS
jgi:PAS domain S-box-containing protein